MGMFDHVEAKCPSCGEIIYEQTKAGPCCLNMYRIESMMDPEDANVVSGLYMRCECGKQYEVVVDQPPKIPVSLKEI